MKAILINAEHKTIAAVTISNDADKRLKECQQLLGGYLCIAHEVDEFNTLFVDDEGLFKEENNWFTFAGSNQPYPFKGNGLILGVDDCGETVDCTCTLEQIAEKVSFVKQLSARADNMVSGYPAGLIIFDDPMRPI